METVRIGYARVSTDDQSLNLQLDALRHAGCAKIFTDKLSGKSRRRAGLDDALASLNANDQLVVWRLDRLGRNFRHLVDIADELRERGVNLISISEGIDTSSNVGEIIFRLMSVFSDFERNVIVERTRAGLAAAKARGVKLGRKPGLSASQVAQARQLLQSDMKMNAIARQLAVGRSTLYRYLHRET
ncbi:recombinase family protein [Sphingobium sp. DEHP117]|uniref:recombinase family protein n=1 Tax=Sphingobium sp. DEHP117 TaxID=2993436 RepID=UPI0027D4B84A|nr:recombinase family protein [Sphingobium sp. DEHP117]MDQ4418848.1 recombinase family protein [Sphingobium sp. DEHP117]